MYVLANLVTVLDIGKFAVRGPPLARYRVPQWKRIVGLAGGARPGEASERGERGERPGE